MLKCFKGLPVSIAAALLSVSSFAADLSSPNSTITAKSDGSYIVTDILPAREACPGYTPTIVRRYLSNGLKQSATSDLFCGSYVEKVFAPDGSLRGSRRFERKDAGSPSRLTSVEFDNRGGDWDRVVVLLSASQQVQSITVSFGAKFRNVTLICNRQPNDGLWRIDELAGVSDSQHQVMTVPTIRAAVPAEIPTSFAEIQQVWNAALAETARASQPTAAIQPVRALSVIVE